MSTIILLGFVLNILCDQICDVITCCVSSCDTGKINVHDKSWLKSEKKENMEINENFYVNFHLKDRLDIEFTVC